MAFYIEEQNVVKAKPNAIFTAIHSPGHIVPNSGIYRCVNCGDEDCCNKGDPFPPQNRHQHRAATPIGWKLLVLSQQVK
jgi:hypothetical protein